MLPKLLAVIESKCNNTAYRPVMDALDVLARYADVPNKVRHFDGTDKVPITGVVPDAWLEAVVDSGGVIERVSYELCVLVALKNTLRRREIYVHGSTPWRNPEEDLPADFEGDRDVHYENLRQPLDPAEFITRLQEAMRTSMDQAAAAIGRNRSGGTKVKTHRGEPRWHVPDLGILATPDNPGSCGGCVRSAGTGDGSRSAGRMVRSITQRRRPSRSEDSMPMRAMLGRTRTLRSHRRRSGRSQGLSACSLPA
ncbi:hypothetical protein AB0L25_20695 [Spirillospora sp. NPDC052242]